MTLRASPVGAGARVEYLHRINKSWSAFGAGDIGFTRNSTDWSAEAGIRGKW